MHKLYAYIPNGKFVFLLKSLDVNIEKSYNKITEIFKNLEEVDFDKTKEVLLSDL